MKKKAPNEDSNKFVAKGEFNSGLYGIRMEIVNVFNLIEEKDHKFHILHEDTNHKLGLLAEGQQMIIERLDRETTEIKGILTNHERRITTLEIKDR